MNKQTVQKLKATYNDFDFIIEEDLPEVGVYLYVYKISNCIFDTLQNNINDCKEIALKMYGV